MRTCFYELLEVSTDASDSELKKAYRKKALEHHPDKNRENIDEATERFAQIRAAYEVLSDPQERAWYDDHKEQILNDSFDEFGDEETDYEVDASVTGVTTEELLRFFDRRLYSRLDDSPAGFYQIAGKIFAKLASDEVASGIKQGMNMYDSFLDRTLDDDVGSQGYLKAINLHESSRLLFPMFGYSKTSHKKLKVFYKSWASFSTVKTFTWKDEYTYSRNYDRRTKREINKRNEKLRAQARTEYNKTVKQFVGFIKKFDIRLKEGAKVEAEEKLKEQASKGLAQSAIGKSPKPVSDRHKEFELQDWQAIDIDQLDEIDDYYAQETRKSKKGKSTDLESPEDEPEQSDECIYDEGPNKTSFKTSAKSDAERRYLRQLRREMRQESIALGLDDVSDLENLSSDYSSDDLIDENMVNLSNRKDLDLSEIDAELKRIEEELHALDGEDDTEFETDYVVDDDLDEDFHAPDELELDDKGANSAPRLDTSNTPDGSLDTADENHKDELAELLESLVNGKQDEQWHQPKKANRKTKKNKKKHK